MGRFIALVLFTNITVCFGLFLFFFVAGGSEAALYVGINSFLLLLFPTAAAVIMYRVLFRTAPFHKLNYLCRSLLLTLLFVMILVLWALGESVLSGSQTGVSIPQEFIGYMVLCMVEAFCLPLIDRKLGSDPGFFSKLFKER